MKKQIEQANRRSPGVGPVGSSGLVRLMRAANSALCLMVLAALWPNSAATAPLTLSLEPVATSWPATLPASTLRLTSLVVSAASPQAEAALFLAGYEPMQWTGSVTAFKVAAGTGAASSTGLWGTVPAVDNHLGGATSSASLLDQLGFVPADRVVLSATAQGLAGTTEVGIAWLWDSLGADQKSALNTLDGKADALGRQRLAYLRGDRTQEISAGGVLRNRRSRHGDIVNSKLWHLASLPAAGYSANGYLAFKSRAGSRDPMLYVGANDGMLHGFSAATGQEKIAYVPLGVHAQLSALTSASYAHRYFVDGSAFSADSDADGSWKTYLAGFLGRGGNGYFVLDVTDPAAFSASNAARLVVLDQTGRAESDIGHITSEPVRERDNTALTRQISQLNDGRWALITGNGYNSTHENAVLLIQYLDGARELKKIHATSAASPSVQLSNGLSAPRLIDLNGDKIPDIAYAGDLLGNLWKFDLSSADASAWATAFGGAPLYVARDAATPGRTQPITSAPVWLAHPQGGIMVVFGTGRNLTDADRTDTSIQTVYGVRDDTLVTREAGRVRLTRGRGALPAGRGTLVQQHIGQTPSAAGAAGSGAALWTLSSHPVPYSGADAKQGWYLDLPAGERVLSNPGWFEGQLVDLYSTVPASGKTWLTTLNAISGNAPRSQIYGDPLVATTGSAGATGTASRIESGMRTALTQPATRSEKGLCAPSQSCFDRLLLPNRALRPSWRQLQ